MERGKRRASWPRLQEDWRGTSSNELAQERVGRAVGGVIPTPNDVVSSFSRALSSSVVVVVVVGVPLG